MPEYTFGRSHRFDDYSENEEDLENRGISNLRGTEFC